MLGSRRRTLILVSKRKQGIQTFKPAAYGSSQKQTWKPLNGDGKETRNYLNETRLALEGSLKNLVLVVFEKSLTDYLIEQGAAV